MASFDPNNTLAKTFIDIDGQAVSLRPVYDSGLRRTVVELKVGEKTAKLSTGAIPDFTDFVLIAAVLAETANLAEDHSPKSGE